jgi:NAD(P)H-flavin reductase
MEQQLTLSANRTAISTAPIEALENLSVDEPAMPIRLYRVVATRRETRDVRTLRLAPVAEAIDRFRAGQFALVRVAGVGEVALPITGGPLVHDHTVEFTIRTGGTVREALFQARDCRVVGISGPVGTSWDVCDAVGEDLVFVADGLGLASLRSALLEAVAVRGCFRRITVVAGAGTPGDLLFAQEYERWRARGVQVLLTVSRVPLDPCTLMAPAWEGPVGSVSELLDTVCLRPERTVVYLCGPEAMMAHAGGTLARHGVAPERIRLSIQQGLWFGCLTSRERPVTTLDRAASFLGTTEL